MDTAPPSPTASPTPPPTPTLSQSVDANPIKRGPGRPRKHPLPPAALPSSHVSQPAYNAPLPSPYYSGASMEEMQKWIMKKKIKKYVQKYMDKAHASAAYDGPAYDGGASSYARYAPAEEEVDERSEEDTVAPTYRRGQAPPPPNSKLAQILGYR